MILQISAIVIFVIFYGCYFGKMFLQRRQGIQTDQIGKGKTGMVLGIELTMKVASIAVPIAEVISIYRNTAWGAPWFRCAGLIVAVLGDLIFIVSVFTMKDSWRAGVSKTDKTKLVTSGIYQFSRNPAFLGFDLVYIGICMMFFNWILFCVSAFAIFMFHLQIVNVEEDFLQEAFGTEYLEYKKTVNRYLGRKHRVK